MWITSYSESSERCSPPVVYSKGAVLVIVLLLFLYLTRWFVSCLVLCYFVLVFFRPFSIAITSLGEERVNLSVFRTFLRFMLVWFCVFPVGVWEGLQFVYVILHGLFSYFFFYMVIICIFIVCCMKFPTNTHYICRLFFYNISKVLARTSICPINTYYSCRLFFFYNTS